MLILLCIDLHAVADQASSQSCAARTQEVVHAVIYHYSVKHSKVPRCAQSYYYCTIPSKRKEGKNIVNVCQTKKRKNNTNPGRYIAEPVDGSPCFGATRILRTRRQAPRRSHGAPSTQFTISPRSYRQSTPALHRRPATAIPTRRYPIPIASPVSSVVACVLFAEGARRGGIHWY